MDYRTRRGGLTTLDRLTRGGHTVRIQPAPGAYAGHRCWRSREHYLRIVVPAALAARPRVLADLRLAPDTFTRYIRIIAGFADHSTGRHIERTRDQIAAALGASVRTVQRCRRAAEQLDLYVTVLHGRTMTRAERLQKWAAGSRHRNLANSAALIIPAWLADSDVDDVTPPGSARSASRASGPITTTIEHSSTVSAPRPATTTPPAATKCNYRSHSGSGSVPRKGLGLARALRQRVPWLRQIRPGRIAARLARFETHGWTATHLIEAFDHIHRRLGWNSPIRTRTPGWNLLGWYLDQLDTQADHPHFDPEPSGPVTQWGPAEFAELANRRQATAASRPGSTRSYVGEPPQRPRRRAG